MREIVALLAELTGIRAPRVAIPHPLLAVLGRANEWLSTHVTRRPPWITREAALHARDCRRFDVAKARRELGYEPRGAGGVCAAAGGRLGRVAPRRGRAGGAQRARRPPRRARAGSAGAHPLLGGGRGGPPPPRCAPRPGAGGRGARRSGRSARARGRPAPRA